jgi:hypothetical protein
MLNTIVKSSWKTTVVGLALIIAGIYTGVTGVTSWVESNLVITIGIGLLFTKDHDK